MNLLKRYLLICQVVFLFFTIASSGKMVAQEKPIVYAKSERMSQESSKTKKTIILSRNSQDNKVNQKKASNKATYIKAPSSKDIMEELAKKLNSFEAMHASFRQEAVVNVARSSRKIEEGELWLNKKGGFRWHIQKPYDQVIISNGKKVWMIEKDFQQVTIRSNKGTIDDTIANLLSGRDARQFLKAYSLQHAKQKGHDWYTLLPPHGKGVLFEQLDLIFQKELLVSVIFKDLMGGRSQIDFNKIKTGTEVELKFNTQSLFVGSVPRGFDVLDDTKM